MRAAVYRGAGRVAVEDVPQPPVAEGELLLRVDACGICGTDVKKIQKGLLPPPRIFGHEIAGRVERVGSGVGRFREGDRLVLHHHIPCGACFYCDVAAFAQCETYKRNGTTAGFEPAGGGFAEYVKALPWIVERGAIPIPDGLSAEEACFVEPVNTCLKAVRKAGVEKGQTVLVVGQGPIGLLLLQLCRWAGADVLVSDLRPERLPLARSLGAAEGLDARGDVAAETRRLTGGRGTDVAFLAAVGTPALTQAVGATRPAGKILVFAATSPGETAEIDLGALCSAEKEILTSYSASIDVQDTAAQLVFSREVRVRELISHRLPLEEASEGIGLVASGAPDVLKVILRPTTEGG
jgi:L-iditol 2-dehydrogenase